MHTAVVTTAHATQTQLAIHTATMQTQLEIHTDAVQIHVMSLHPQLHGHQSQQFLSHDWHSLYP
jgi:hypothetical protein